MIRIDTQLIIIRLLVCINLITMVIVYGMNESDMHKEFFTEFNSVPRDLQRYTQQLMIYGALHFLGFQPIIFKQDKQVFSAVISGNKLVMGSEAIAKVYDMQTGFLLCTLNHNLDPNNENNLVWSVAVDGENVFTAASDGIARMWNMASGSLLRIFEGHTKSIYSLAVCNDILVTGSVDKTVRVWDVQSGITRYVFDGHDGAILSVALDIEKIASGSDRIARIWDIHKGDLLYQLNEHISGVASVILNDGKLATVSEEGIVKVWNVCNGELLCTCDAGYDIEVNSLAINDSLLVIGLEDGIIKMWDIQNGTLLHKFKAHDGTIWSVVVKDGKLITGSEDKTAKIWPLSLDVQGKPDDNPLKWISVMPEENDTVRVLQAYFIARAYQATVDNNDFIIDLPEKLGEIKDSESSAQKDGRIYFTFPAYVRKLLRDCLNIRK